MKKLILTFILAVLTSFYPLSIDSTKISISSLKSIETHQINYTDYIGKPYQYHIFDCSAFITILLKIPERLSAKDLYSKYHKQYPQLLFFKIDSLNNHIALEINDSTIIHNTKSKGVNILSKKDAEFIKYWKNYLYN